MALDFAALARFREFAGNLGLSTIG